MSKTFLLTVALMVGASCGSHTILQTSHTAVSQSSPTPPSPTSPIAENRRDVSNDAEKKQDVPPAFKNIDFKNFSYPIGGMKAFIRLKDGKYEYDHEHYKELGDGWVDFSAVNYSDVTGDGREEAIVQLIWVACGVSCDGGSHLFYFYSIANGSVKLISRIETGSIAYTCGLKSFVLRRQSLALEAFRRCRFNGVTLESPDDADVGGNKFTAQEFTRLTFEFNERRFVLKKREVLRNPETNVKNYEPRIDISKD